MLTEAHWSQVELSNQISELQYGFKRMRIIGFPGYTCNYKHNEQIIKYVNVSAWTSVFKERSGTKK